MKFRNITEMLTWGRTGQVKRKKDIIRNIDEQWALLDKLHTKIDSLETICIHKYDNRNCWDGHNLHDVVIALLQHSGMELKKRHSLSLEDKNEL